MRIYAGPHIHISIKLFKELIQNVKAAGIYSYHSALKVKGLKKLFPSLPYTWMIARGMFYYSLIWEKARACDLGG
jgi:hypothetical protein